VAWRNDSFPMLGNSVREATVTLLISSELNANVLLQLAEARLYILRKSASRSSSSFPVENGHGYHEVLLPLRAGSLCFLMR